jgi:hypothetical protein
MPIDSAVHFYILFDEFRIRLLPSECKIAEISHALTCGVFPRSPAYAYYTIYERGFDSKRLAFREKSTGKIHTRRFGDKETPASLS